MRADRGPEEALEVMRIVAGLPDVLQRFGLADPPVDRVCGGLLVLREEEGEGRGPAAAADDADTRDGRGFAGHAAKVCPWRGNPYFCGPDGCNAHLPCFPPATPLTMAQQDDQLKRVIGHAKEYGFVFPSSDIYDGLVPPMTTGSSGWS